MHRSVESGRACLLPLAEPRSINCTWCRFQNCVMSLAVIRSSPPALGRIRTFPEYICNFLSSSLLFLLAKSINFVFCLKQDCNRQNLWIVRSLAQMNLQFKDNIRRWATLNKTYFKQAMLEWLPKRNCSQEKQILSGKTGKSVSFVFAD